MYKIGCFRDNTGQILLTNLWPTICWQRPFLPPIFSLSEQDKHTRRLDGVQSSQLYLCENFIWGLENRGFHRFFRVMCFLFAATFIRDPSPSFLHDLWTIGTLFVGTFIGQSELFLCWLSDTVLWIVTHPDAEGVLTHSHMLMASFCGMLLPWAQQN